MGEEAEAQGCEELTQGLALLCRTDVLTVQVATARLAETCAPGPAPPSLPPAWKRSS